METENMETEDEQSLVLATAPSFHTIMQIIEKEAKVLGKSFSKAWAAYQSFVRENHVSLEVAETALNRVLFWTPDVSQDGSISRWREVIYGLMSLHRLWMETALQEEIENCYGMSIRPNEQPLIPATGIRFALTVVRNLIPSFLEVANSTDMMKSSSRQESIRAICERIKFALRIVLITSYWWQMSVRKTDGESATHFGLMREGGHLHFQDEWKEVPTKADEEALRRRRAYRGRRTGRTVSTTGISQGTSSIKKTNYDSWRWFIGEFLYAYRPLYWSLVGSPRPFSKPSHKQWLISLLFDIVSLQCLSCVEYQNNRFTQAELSRRKLRLLLYVLRAPVWESGVSSYSNKVENALERLPLVGGLASAYLRDWIWYVKHPYVSEDG